MAGWQGTCFAWRESPGSQFLASAAKKTLPETPEGDCQPELTLLSEAGHLSVWLSLHGRVLGGLCMAQLWPRSKVLLWAYLEYSLIPPTLNRQTLHLTSQCF